MNRLTRCAATLFHLFDSVLVNHARRYMPASPEPRGVVRFSAFQAKQATRLWHQRTYAVNGLGIDVNRYVFYLYE